MSSVSYTATEERRLMLWPTLLILMRPDFLREVEQYLLAILNWQL